MDNTSVYVIGCGAIGFPLAASLCQAGKNVIAVRSSARRIRLHSEIITVENQGVVTEAAVPVTSLDLLKNKQGIFVITAKTFANQQIAAQLQQQNLSGPIVLMQNGLGIESAYTQAGFQHIFRTVLYFTSEKKAGLYLVKQVKASVIGLVRGNSELLPDLVNQLQNPLLAIEATEQIKTRVWQKTIANVVFNSICPLLEQDNGIFFRQPAALACADSLIAECILVAKADGAELDHQQIRQQILAISQASSGLLISTLQDLQAKRQTEMEDINLAVARKAEFYGLQEQVRSTRALGELILLKQQFIR
jgi:2-dehydropantoate 2-reductase